MVLLADIKAMRDVTRIKSGETAKLSMSQITCLITNMSDARKKLSAEEFNAVNTLFKEFRNCKTKIQMDVYGYIDAAERIIMKFDTIAPYEKYSGGNELEFSFMMDDMRKISNNSDPHDIQKRKDIVFNDDDYKYMNNLIEQSFNQINQEDAHEIMRVIYWYHDYGKAYALEEFDILANKLIEKSAVEAIFKISFMAGLLYPNGILSKKESDDLAKKYTILVTENLGK